MNNLRSKWGISGVKADILLFILVEVFLLITFPENRTETDDGAWYAYIVRDQSIHSLYNPRFLLFLPFVKLITWLMPGVDTYNLICYFSMFFAGLTIILLRKMLNSFTDWPDTVNWWVVILVLISYEFWRYAFESEVYMLAIFMTMLCLYLQLKIYKNGPDTLSLLSLIACSSLTVLFYKPAFIIVFMAIPVFLILKGRWLQTILLYGISGLIILGVYYLTYRYYLLKPESFVAHLMGGVNDPVGNPWMAPIVVVSNFISTIWVFGVKELGGIVSSAFAHKVVQEEFLTASQVGNMSYFLILLCVILGLLLLSGVFYTIKYFRQNGISKTLFTTVLIFIVILYGGFLVVMDPSSNEPWIMLSIPLAVLIGYYLFLPLYGLNKKWIVNGILILVLLINYFGGIGLLRDPAYDFNRLKSEWLSEHVQEGDLILSLGPMSFIRYLNYYTKGDAYNYEEQLMMKKPILDSISSFQGDIYITEDMINPIPAITFRSGITSEVLDSVYSVYSYIPVPVDTSNKFVTYKLLKR